MVGRCRDRIHPLLAEHSHRSWHVRTQNPKQLTQFKNLLVKARSWKSFVTKTSPADAVPSDTDSNRDNRELDGTGDVEDDLALILEEFKKANIKLARLNSKNKDAKKCLLVLNKMMKPFKSPFPVCWVDDLRSAVWNRIGLIWVKTKTPTRKPDWPPVALKEGSTVNDLAEKVHKDFIRTFKYARIWGKSVKHDGTNAGMEHVLLEGDIVEFHLR